MLVNFRKWDGGEHWQEPTTYLGTDEHGVWLGMLEGTTFRRPGRQVISRADSVKVATTCGWFGTFNGPGHHIHTYIDITTIGAWSRTERGFTFTVIDLDLDIVREQDGRLYIDDEDEFEQHQRSFGYPADVIAQAERDCCAVYDAVERGSEPFLKTAQHWMAQLLSER